jgi:hypothetical protein
LHSDAIFSIGKFSFGSAIGSVSVRQLRQEINSESSTVWPQGRTKFFKLEKTACIFEREYSKTPRAVRRPELHA